MALPHSMLVQGAMNESYTYAPGSNRLTSVSGSAVRGFTYDAGGNAMSDDRGAAGNYAYAYDQSGNMSQLSRDGLILVPASSGAGALYVRGAGPAGGKRSARLCEDAFHP